ncbi:PilZ domain-containing protein [Sphingosinicella rhizophila]|uniref:PilZ domain-containing protein n=1 Tax=Sphingosinicella rhizophila TaxID=3050082 RepID=A0ABU3Q890_9SPHN|nr:PilZ domain-containing protein [Sphingosinicella sp. GR2756]MDT9599314.1 PilZ domain-containing protein [Sphingosinicella sp. GR2756]
MDLTGQLAFENSSEHRKSERRDVALGAGLRQRGASSVTVEILDLSVHGFRAETHLELEPGTDLWLKLPGLESLHGRVAWMRGHLLGGEFVRPLHPAVLDMIVSKASGR